MMKLVRRFKEKLGYIDEPCREYKCSFCGKVDVYYEFLLNDSLRDVGIGSSDRHLNLKCSCCGKDAYSSEDPYCCI